MSKNEKRAVAAAGMGVAVVTGYLLWRKMQVTPEPGTIPRPKKCPPGTGYDYATDSCVDVTPECPEGYVFDEGKGECVIYEEPPPPPPPLPVVVSFATVQPQPIQEGVAFHLAWTTKYATLVKIYKQGMGEISEDAPNGQMPLQGLPEGMHYYSIVAYGPGGEASDELSVQVVKGEVKMPEVLVFHAEPREVVETSSSILKWETKYATSVDILEQGGEQWRGLPAIGQMKVEFPAGSAGSHYYVILANGPGGQAAAEESIMVNEFIIYGRPPE